MSIRLDPRLQTLSAQLQEVALKPLLEGPHTIEGTLYHHYTSALGGLKILESGDLWATNIDFLNDPDETQYGERFCLRFLQNVIEEYRPVDNEFVTLLDGIQKVIWQFAEDIFPHELQFLTSFSLEGDLLSQWRAYADNGKGLSLGFSNTEILYRLVENFAEGDETKVPRPIPHLVLYEKSEQEALLRNVVNALYDAWPALKTDFYKNDEINKGLKSIGALKFATATMCFKQHTYREEREVRLLYGNIREMKTSGTKLEINVRERDGLLIPYRTVGLNQNKKLLPLTKIIIGSKMDKSRTQRALGDLLWTLGYREETMPELVHSAVRMR